MKKILQKIAKKMGYTLTKSAKNNYPDIKEKEFWNIYAMCKPYTMTSIERMYALYSSTDYVLKNNIEGDFVECGVWRGGSAMLLAMMLNNRNITNRKIHLFDTFEGMTAPSSFDFSFSGENATELLSKNTDESGKPAWCLADINDVKNNMQKTGFPSDNLVYVKGKVEDTLPLNKPTAPIALLRLDTDWYESTKHELNVLYPILTHNGILIIDDYGHWEGCRKAVDEYISENKVSILLNRIDYTGRVAIKNINA
jgi:O-methyltransferase